MREFNKIHVIALPRCATVSMSDALGMLGISIAHLGKVRDAASQDHHDNNRLIQMHRQISSGDFDLDILKECDGLADYPACIKEVIEALDERYPGSLFINIRRDDEIAAWLQSVERQFIGLRLIKTGVASTEQDRGFADAMADFRRMTFGQTQFDPDVFTEAYWRFQQFVDTFFANRPEVLLTISDIRQLEHDGFKRLSDFLHCPVINAPFPRSNEHSIPPQQAFEAALRDGRIVSKTGIVPSTK